MLSKAVGSGVSVHCLAKSRQFAGRTLPLFVARRLLSADIDRGNRAVKAGDVPVELRNVSVDSKREARVASLKNVYQFPQGYKLSGQDIDATLFDMLVTADGTFLDIIPSNYITDELMATAVQSKGEALRFIAKNKMTLDICKVAISNDPNAIEYVPDSIQALFSKEDWLSIVRVRGVLLKFMSEPCRDDFDIAYEAIQNDGMSYEFLSNNLKENKDLSKLALEKDVRVYKFFSDRFKETFFLDAFRKSDQILFYAPGSILNQPDDLLPFVLRRPQIILSFILDHDRVRDCQSLVDQLVQRCRQRGQFSILRRLDAHLGVSSDASVKQKGQPLQTVSNNHRSQFDLLVKEMKKRDDTWLTSPSQDKMSLKTLIQHLNTYCFNPQTPNDLEFKVFTHLMELNPQDLIYVIEEVENTALYSDHSKEQRWLELKQLFMKDIPLDK